MKNIKYIMLALLCGLFTGCMNGDWDTPSGGHTACEKPTEQCQHNVFYILHIVFSISD